MFSSLGRTFVTRVFATALLALTVSVACPVTAARGAIEDTWSWPIAAPWRIQRPYVAPPTPYGVGHRGIDLVAAVDTPVLAPAAGTVLFAGNVVDRGVISIDHGGGVTSSYEPVTAVVHAGQSVQAGDTIGHIIGLHATVSEACPCLHLGARIDGQYLSPLAFLSAIDRAVLLPWRD